MRAWIVVMGLVVAGPAWGQDALGPVDQAEQSRFTKMAEIIADAVVANRCQYRSMEWMQKALQNVSKILENTAQDDAVKITGINTRAAGHGFAVGVALMAVRQGYGEFERYGPASCIALTKSGNLQDADTAVGWSH